MRGTRDRRRWLISLTAGIATFAAIVVGFSGTAQPVRALNNCTVSDAEISLDSEEQAFLTLINNYRTQNGRGALSTTTSLNRASAWMANDLGVKAYFSHDEPSGRNWSQRLTDCEHPTGGWRGENIAAGTVRDTALEAFTAWQNSPGHNANMLSANFTRIGIGRKLVPGSPYNWYWVTDFGTKDDAPGGGATNTPTATPTRTNTPVPPAATPTSTNTPVPPTATPTRTNTPVPPAATPTSTNTPVAPTATPTRTNTPVPPTATPTHTNTPVLPPATNTPAVPGAFNVQSVSPAFVTAGGSAFTLTVDGAGFAPGATVRLNGSPRGTQFVSPTRLLAAVSAGDIGAPGGPRVSVQNAGGAIAGDLVLTVNPAPIQVTTGATGGLWAYAPLPVDALEYSLPQQVSAVFVWDNATQTFRFWFRGFPAGMATLTQGLPTGSYAMFQATGPVTVSGQSAPGFTIPAPGGSFTTHAGATAQVWSGSPTGVPMNSLATALPEQVSAVFAWDPQTQSFRFWFRGFSGSLNTLTDGLQRGATYFFQAPGGATVTMN